ncbi:RNA-directed DNA polymerase from mobile element jockey-like [Brachionus plicatilis]|uniref:RNA-directed DNA polymerase from mobile element jockey-like n=1 Tax=Brachionus plicatilis TaxID=10195 RepID=A0A3M7Q4E7_BRAPC|nr:RNA-directed DNA polymerase from mobile element jockey-like [Brachionus plicatilis]
MHGLVEGKSNAGVLSDKFITNLEDNFLVQHVQESTFGNKILDLVLTDNPDNVYSVNIGPHLGTTTKNKLHSVLSWDYLLKGDYESLEKYLWTRITEMVGHDSDSMFNCLLSIFLDGVSKFIPNLSLSEKNITTRTNPKWFNKNIKKWTNLKYKGFIVTRIFSKNQAINELYNRICRIVKKEVSNAKLCYESNIIKGCKNHPKRIFSYINSQKNSRDGIRSLKDEMGNLVNDKLIVANIFNTQFQAAFSLDDGKPLQDLVKKCDIELFVTRFSYHSETLSLALQANACSSSYYYYYYY